MYHFGLNKNAMEKKCDKTQKNAINDVAKLRHPQPRPLISLIRGIGSVKTKEREASS